MTDETLETYIRQLLASQRASEVTIAWQGGEPTLMGLDFFKRAMDYVLNIRTDYPIDSPRITKAEQVSKNRFHNELKLTSASEIDEDFLGWLKDAYALG